MSPDLGHSLVPKLDMLYRESIGAKVVGFAELFLQRENVHEEYPELVPADGEHAGKYQTKPARFWTCGFFPGCLYALLERNVSFPKHLPLTFESRTNFQTQLLGLCRAWSRPLHAMAERTDTHDLGFIILPSFRADWELTGNTASLSTIVRAAYSLSSRWHDACSAIRSWNQVRSARYDITDTSKNFLVIIDSMCNLELLFYAGHHTENSAFIERATAHAHTILTTLVRPDWSTYHVANLNPETGDLWNRFTHQGYSDESSWARGQAWAILGFTQAYQWTKQSTFLNAAINLADYFLSRLNSSPNAYPYVPAWDFDAPGANEPRDTSAGMIAANGLLLLHQAMQAQGQTSRYLQAVFTIIQDTLALSMAEDAPRFVRSEDGKLEVEGIEFDAILKHSTANNNQYALCSYADHGLVYADYFFLELGNKLLRMGLA